MGRIHFPIREILQIGEGTREYRIHPEYCPPFRRHAIQLAGISHTTKHFRFIRMHPTESQILVCLRGEGRVWVDEEWKTCGPGQAYLTPVGPRNAYEAVRGWEVAWVVYSTAVVRVDKPRLIEVDPRPLEYILQGLHHEFYGRREDALLGYWTELLQMHVVRIVKLNHSSKLWRFWQTVQDDLGSPWDLDTLARRAGMGIEQLRRVCLEETGESPMRHLTRMRMQHAVSLLAEGSKVDAAAHAVGYENPFAFSTAFSRIMRRPPSSYNPSRTAKILLGG
jgi:AraC-like DNA-binding protein